MGGGPGVGGGPEDTDQGLQQRGQEDTRPQPGHWPAPMVTRLTRWPAGGQHTQAGHGQEAHGGEARGGEAGWGHIQPAEAETRGHQLRPEADHEADGVEEARCEAEQEDTDRRAGEQEGGDEALLLPGSGGHEDDQRLQQEEAEAGQVEDAQRGHGH